MCSFGCSTPNCSVFASTGTCCHRARRESKLGLITKKWLRSLLGLTKGLTKGFLQDYPTERSLQLNENKIICPLSATWTALWQWSFLSWHGHGLAQDRFCEVWVTGAPCTAPEDGNRHRWQHTAHHGHLSQQQHLNSLGPAWRVLQHSKDSG